MEAWVGRSMGNVNSCIIVMICAIFVVAGTHTHNDFVSIYFVSMSYQTASLMNIMNNKIQKA